MTDAQAADTKATDAKDTSLEAYLEAAVAQDPSLAPVAETLRAVAGAAARVAEQIRLGPLSPEAMPQGGSKNSDGDVQKALDLLTDKIFMEAMAKTPVAVLVSEELAEPKRLNAGAPLVVAIDPLDGSSNIDNNVSIGTIISILPALPDAADDAAHFKQPGRNQRAAGFVVYGPQTIFVLSIGKPTEAFILDPRIGRFVAFGRKLQIADDSHEFAINASNYRHWDPAVRAYIDDCFHGKNGRLSRDHNMRWIASMVADTFRIFMRGGVFLYPGDQRKGYEQGRLRLLYEVSPVSFLVEHAGGKATDGRERILDKVARDVHERSPLVFGSAKVVDTITAYHIDPSLAGG
jgi:fructose-1,6-bisphosphatase I